MLPRELVEELVRGLDATGFHVLVTVADASDGFLVVLKLPSEVLGQHVVVQNSHLGSGLIEAARAGGGIAMWSYLGISTSLIFTVTP